MKQLFFLIFIFVLILVFIKWFSVNDSNIEKFYVSNLTWNTSYGDFAYAKKWDKLSFLYKLKNDWKLQYSGSCIFSLLDVYSWEIYVKPEKNFYFLTVVWFAKKNWKYLKKNISRCIYYEKWNILKKSLIKKKKKVSKEIKPETKINNFSIWWPSFRLMVSDIVSNLDNMIMLTWKNLEKLKSVWLQDKFWKIEKIKWNYYAFILKNDLKGYYLLMWVDKNWKLLTTDQKINVRHYSWSLVVSYVNPDKVYPGAYVNIVGKWFKKIISIQFSNSFITKKTDFKILSDSMIVVKIPYLFDKWSYYVNFMTTDWIYSFKNIKIYVKNLNLNNK